jgi:hypothetical protein
LGLLGCKPANEPVLGRFEVVGAVADGHEIDGPTAAAGENAGVSWARESWILEKDRLVVERQILRPAQSGPGHVACEVSVRVQAAWSGAVLTIPYAATSRAAAEGAEPIGCEVSVQSGEWRIAKLAGKPWDYEMKSGNRTLRLVAGSENPDYGSKLEAAAGSKP